LPDNAQPAPSPMPARLWRLATVRSCRKELSQVYREARSGKLGWQEAARAASILQIMAKMIESGDFEQRIERLEQAVAGRDAQPPRRNGHASYARL
jgi:hypothetical protein